MTQMKLEAALEILQEKRGDAIVLVTMSPVAFWTGGRNDFRLVGLMGGAGSIGLGVAIGRPDRQVWVLDGDGSLLMQLGVLTAVAGAAPANFRHLVVVNEHYSVSGGQPLPSTVAWEQLFRGSGYAQSATCRTEAELEGALADSRPGPWGIALQCSIDGPPPRPDAVGVSIREEVRRLRTVLTSG
jgi:thiamine pyrophosphate-dependent acetolactate synthase large subunit-like protein